MKHICNPQGVVYCSGKKEKGAIPLALFFMLKKKGKACEKCLPLALSHWKKLKKSLPSMEELFG